MSKRLALLGLLLLVPVPSVGVLAGVVLTPGSVLGRVVFLSGKVWLVGLPLFWYLVLEKGKVSWSRPARGGLGVGAVLGVLIGLAIGAVYWAAGEALIERAAVQQMAQRVGLANRYVYVAGAVYWVVVNAVLEEYVWRWFVVKECRALIGAWGAVVVSAVCFTVHHAIAMQVYFSWEVVALASAGICVGGMVWSWCYVRYGSIWPGYVSHAIVDVAVFAVGYDLIFG